MKGFWLLTILAAILAGLVLVGGVMMSKGAPQEAAVAGIALGIAVIPYVFVRSLEGWASATWRQQMLEAIERGNANFKTGTDAMWQQLDAIRMESGPANSGASPTSIAEKAPQGMGYCPGCQRLRAFNSAKCIYCGSTEPA